MKHLKRKISNGNISIEERDVESQRTSSANYSVSSSLQPPQSFITSCVGVCCYKSRNSTKAEQGSSVGECGDLSIATVDVLITPDATARINTDVTGWATVLPTLTVTHASPANDCMRIAQAEQLTVEESMVERGVVSTAEQHLTVGKPTVTNIVSPYPGQLYINDADFLCSIANTYDLGGDSDTLSYISNCLHGSSYKASRRPVNRYSSHSGLAMLGSDQLYPDSMRGVTVGYKRPTSRRRSLATSTASNVYVNYRGNPLII